MATLIQMPTERDHHLPVLAAELVALLDPQPGEVAVDCTFGAGGHARLIADRIGPTGRLVAIDRDPAAAERFAALAPELASPAMLIEGEFSGALAELAGEGLEPDIVYLDLGVSSMQLDVSERGFSYSYDAPLDMRMDPGQDLSALELVNEWPADSIATVLRELGEERHARSIAAEIVRRRPLDTHRRAGRGDSRRRAARVSLRPRPSGEAELSGDPDRRQRRARCARPRATACVGDAPGRRQVAAISFHSLEDRRVKRFLAGLARGCVCPPEQPICTCGHEPEAELLVRRVVKPSEEEAATNPRSRSARLRVARKLRPAGDAGSPRI